MRVAMNDRDVAMRVVAREQAGRLVEQALEEVPPLARERSPI
jgi:hypothetical protein